MAKKRKVARKKPITGSWERFGIQNHIGGMWTPETFQTEVEAMDYLEQQRPHYGDLRRHKVVPVRVTVTACG